MIILVVLLFGGGGGYYGYSRWGSSGGISIVGLVLIIVVLFYALGGVSVPVKRDPADGYLNPQLLPVCRRHPLTSGFGGGLIGTLIPMKSRTADILIVTAKALLLQYRVFNSH